MINLKYIFIANCFITTKSLKCRHINKKINTSKDGTAKNSCLSIIKVTMGACFDKTG